ncbi:MAG: RagB/SusD family nutrient uptake outer membrane protein [Bacteroidota bacterium]
MFVFKLNKIALPVLFAASLLLTLGSCNKQLDISSSRQADEAGHWTTYEDARSGLIGLYGLSRAAVAANNAHWLWGELRAGDFRSVYRPDLRAIVEGNLNASFPAIEGITDWRRFYAVINACNLFIERVNGCMADKRYTEAYYKLDIAQARAIRAFIYFYIVRIWGDVPFITKSNEGSFEALPRTNKDVVLSFAEQELIAAAPRLPFLYSGTDPEQLFPPNYYGVNTATWLNGPFNRLAAYAVLAHISAWQGRYLDVAVYTEYIVNNFTKCNLTLLTTGQLVGDGSNPGGVFNARGGNYNQLLGFSFINNRGETTSDGHFEQLTLANTTLYPMSKQLPDIYVPKDVINTVFPGNNPYDQRFGVDTSTRARLQFTAYFENYSSEIPVFKKVRVVNGATSVTGGQFAVFNSSVLFTRLEEIKLLRAEALTVLGESNLAAAELNAIRGNRGTSSYLVGSSADLLTEIFAERRKELMGEGWRWYDQVRFNRLKRNNPQFNDLLNRDGIYWPIAQDVLNRNPKLVQNTFWK